jgi:hypothetical protein
MLVTTTRLFYDGIVRRKPGEVFDWPLDSQPVINPRVVKPVDSADQVEFDRLCLPVDKRPKLVVKVDKKQDEKVG